MPVDIEAAASAAAEEILGRDDNETATSEEPSPEGATAEAQPAAGAADPAEAARWRAQAEAEERRREETAAWGHQGWAQAQLLQQQLAQAEQQRQYEAQQFQRGRMLPPPTIQDPNELVDKPEKLVEYQQRMAGWVLAQMGSHLAPIQQELAAYRATMPVMVQAAARGAFGEARQSLAESGLPAQDFDAIAPEVFQRLQAQPALLADPQRVAQAALAVAYEKGHRFTGQARGDTPMPSIGVGGSGAPAQNGGGRKPVSASPWVGVVEKALGRKLDPKKVAAMERDRSGSGRGA